MDASTPVGGLGEPTSVRLFGVKLTDIPKIERDIEEHSIGSMDMRKTVSMSNLCLAVGVPTQRHLDMALGLQEDFVIGKGGAQIEEQTGYVSDCLMQNSSLSSRERRKGVPWTEEEHRLFLAGLQKLGKGDWRGISRNFVTSRTPTQVASHAQKYFLRRVSLNKRKRRSSLFDIINSNAVPAGNGNDEHSHNTTAAELWERQMPHPAAAFSSGVTSPFASTDHPMPAIPNVSSELCLGRLSQQQRKESPAFTDQGPSLVSKRRGRQPEAGTLAELDKPVFAIASYQSRSLSSSPSTSQSPSRSSLPEIEKVSELSSLSLSIAPPVSTDLPAELALKLEPPMVSRQQKTVIFDSSSKVHKPKDVLLIAGA